MWLIFALGAACAFGLRGILYQWASHKPFQQNVLLMGVYVTGTIVSLPLMLLTSQSFSTGALMGLSMGFFSFTANLAMYRGFAVGRTSVVAILTGLPPVVVAIGAWFFWGERLSFPQWASFLLILSGIVLIRYSKELKQHGAWNGAQWALVALLCFGVTDLSSKQSTVLEADLFPTLFLMYAFGGLLFFAVWLRQMKPNRSMRKDGRKSTALATGWNHPSFISLRWGMLIGITNISGMMLIVSAFREGMAGLVSAIVAANVLLIILYARFFLKERIGLREWSGIALCLCGMAFLKLFD